MTAIIQKWCFMDDYLRKMLSDKEQEIRELRDKISCHIVRERMAAWLAVIQGWLDGRPDS
jgi:hypothetical protein